MSYNRCWPPIGTKLSIELAYLNTWIIPKFVSGIVYNFTIFVLQIKYMYIVQFSKCIANVTWLSLFSYETTTTYKINKKNIA